MVNLKKSKLLLSLMVMTMCVGCAMLLSACRQFDDSKEKTVSVTYNYNFNVTDGLEFKIEDIYDNYKTSQQVRLDTMIKNLPTIKSTSSARLDGWYIAGTDIKVTNGDYLKEDVELEARYKILPSGLYSRGVYCKTWQDILTEYPQMIINDSNRCISIDSTSFSSDRNMLVIDNSVSYIDKLSLGWTCDVFIPQSVLVINDIHSANKVYVDENNTKFNSQDGIVYNKAKTKLIYGVGFNSSAVLEIPDTVVEICDNAFNGNSAIRYMNLPESLKVIGNRAFTYTKLVELNLPDSVEQLGNMAFQDCEKLVNVKMSQNLKKIPNQCFYGCDSLKKVDWLNNVEEIGSFAFSNCTSLVDVDIPANVTSIGDYAFYMCNKLQTVNVASESVANSIVKNAVTGASKIGFDSVQEFFIKNDLNVNDSNYLLENFAKDDSVTLTVFISGQNYECFKWTRKTA